MLGLEDRVRVSPEQWEGARTFHHFEKNAAVRNPARALARGPFPTGSPGNRERTAFVP